MIRFQINFECKQKPFKGKYTVVINLEKSNKVSTRFQSQRRHKGTLSIDMVPTEVIYFKNLVMSV